MQPDRAIHAIVQHQRDDGQAILRGGDEFLSAHQKIAIAADRNHAALGIKPLERHCGGHAIAHGLGHRREMGAEIPETVEAVNPGGETARAVGDEWRRRARCPRSQIIISLRFISPGCGTATSENARYSALAASVSPRQRGSARGGSLSSAAAKARGLAWIGRSARKTRPSSLASG